MKSKLEDIFGKYANSLMGDFNNRWFAKYGLPMKSFIGVVQMSR